MTPADSPLRSAAAMLRGLVRRAKQPSGAGRWVVVATDGGDLADVADHLNGLVAAGHDVAVAHGAGAVPDALAEKARIQRVPELAAVPPRARRWLHREMGEADHVLLLGDGFDGLLAGAGPSARVWRGAAVREVLEEEATWRWFAANAPAYAARDSLEQIPAKWLAKRSRLLTGLPQHELAPTTDIRADLRVLARRLARRGNRQVAGALLEVADLHDAHFPDRPDESAARAALRAFLDLADGLPAPSDLGERVRSVFSAVDDRLAVGDLDDACELASIGLALLFHPRLHTASVSSPLIDDPERFLEPLRQSAFHRGLVDEERVRREERVPREERAGAGEPAAGVEGPGAARTKVVVFPGAYDHHSKPLLRALESTADIDVVVCKLDQPVFAGMAIDSSTVRMRLERSETTSESPAPEAAGAMADADVVVADWADKGAVWASVTASSTARLVVRIHSVDVLSGALHLVDWSAVDVVIAVSPHIADVFRGVLGDRVAHVDLRVVTNRIETDRFTTDKSDDADRTIGLVGWGQAVKDPVMAVRILEGLRARDSRWRLKLIGADFPTSPDGGPTSAAVEFAEASAAQGVVGAIENIGYTHDLPRELRDVGFILSTSLRESCPVGLLEGVASGAFPIVREWPVFARLHAARNLFPQRVVFETVDQAVALIESVQEHRAAEADRVRGEMADLFSVERTSGRLVAAVLGR